MQNEDILFTEIDAVLHCDYFIAVSYVLYAEPHEHVLHDQFQIDCRKAKIILAQMAADGFIEFCRTRRKYFKRITLTEWYNMVTAFSPQGQHCNFSEIYNDDPGKPYKPISYRLRF